MAYLMNRLLISDKMELIHDNQVHASTFIMNVTNANYHQKHILAKKVLLKLFRRINVARAAIQNHQFGLDAVQRQLLRDHLDKFCIIFGYMADLFSSNDKVLRTMEKCKQIHDDIWLGNELSSELKRRYGFEDNDPIKKEVAKIWGLTILIEEAFDLTHYYSQQNIDKKYTLDDVVEIQNFLLKTDFRPLDFIRILSKFYDANSTHLFNILKQSPNKKIFLEIAKTFPNDFKTPEEILDIQKACGENHKYLVEILPLSIS